MEIQYIHNFTCDICSCNFQIESEKKSILDTKGIKCPMCQREWGIDKGVKYNFPNIFTKTSTGSKEKILATRRKENIEKSSYASQQAQMYAASLPQEEMVKVSQNGKTEMVPKRLVEGITEKLKTIKDL